MRTNLYILVLALVTGGLLGQSPRGGDGSPIPVTPPAGGGTPGYAGPAGGNSFGGPGGGGSAEPPAPGTAEPPAPGTPPRRGATPLPPRRFGVGPGGRTPGINRESPNPGEPVGPAGPPGPPAPGTGRTTTPYGLPYPTERWENWWLLNRDAFLDIGRNFAARARGPESSGDEFLGSDLLDASAHPVYLHRKDVVQRVVPLLQALLDDPSAIVRGEAALALGKVGEAAALPDLVRATEDTNRFVRQLALLGLGLTREPEALSALAHVLLDANRQDADRTYAALGIALLGRSDALPAIVTALSRTGLERNLEAALVYALGFLDTDDSEMLLRERADDTRGSGDLRAVAVSGLGKLGSPGSAAHLLRFLKDPEHDVRRSAALALGAVRFESQLWSRRDALSDRIRDWVEAKTLTPEALRRIEEHLAEIERKAAFETRELAALRDKVVKALGETLANDRDRMTRHFAAMSLGRIGSPEARLELAEAYRRSSSNDATRGFVVLALGISRAKESLPLLRRALVQKSLDPSSRGAAMLALGLARDEGAAESLVDIAVQGSDPELRSYAALSVGVLDFRPAKVALRRVFSERVQTFLRPVFGEALALLGDLEVLDLLEGILLDQATSTNAAVEACEALATIHDLRSIDVLVRLLGQTPKRTDFVRAAALHALGIVAEKSALPGIERIARDWNYLLPFPLVNDAMLR